MDVFVKATAGILIALVLCLSLWKQGKDISLLLTIAVCCMIITVAMSYFEPVISFFDKLQAIGQLNSEMLQILLKAVGIGLLAEVTGLICTDVGNAAMGKVLQILASATILCMSIPLLNELIELIDNILGEI